MDLSRMEHDQTSELAALERCEARLRAAVIAGDIAELDALISPTAIYINQSGQRTTKEADLAVYRSGFTIERFDVVGELTVRLLAAAAVVDFVADVAGRVGQETFTARLAYTRVWHRRHGDWRVEAAHSSLVDRHQG